MQTLRPWRVLLLQKPFDVYPPRSSTPPSSAVNPRILHYLDDRCRVHKETINHCQEVLRRKSVEWVKMQRNDLSEPISDVDIVVTVGGDGTLLQASHFLNGGIPVLGVNSDPTQAKEVEDFNDEFDARRSTGYLCAATSENFETVLDEICSGHRAPSNVSRISLTLNSNILPTFALNDVLIAHPCPASVSRFSFRVKSLVQEASSLVNCRSSGLRVCTAAGSTAAMASAGGFPMSISSADLQYMVREPIYPKDVDSMHGFVQYGQSIHAMWYSEEGAIYVDGSHVVFPIRHGDAIKISAQAPALRVFLPSQIKP